MIEEYTKQIDALQKTKDTLYRGQSNSEWILQTSLDRILNGNDILCEKYYLDTEKYIPYINQNLNKSFKNNLPYKNEDFNHIFPSDKIPNIEYITYLRHHQFPTPILDTTKSKYIAIFFACENFFESNTNGKIYIFNKKEIISSSLKNEEYTSTHHIGHYIQQTNYLYSIKHKNYLNYFTNIIENQNYNIDEIKIHKENKLQIMKDLREMNITHNTIYTDEDNKIKSLKVNFFLDNISQ